MKKILAGVVMVAVVLGAMVASAANFDGVYKFTSRSKEGTPDMQGWWGMMVIKNNTMSRIYRSPDGTQEKYYVGTLTQNGTIYTVKFTDTYKPEYVGNEHRNTMTVDGMSLVIGSEDGKFKEVWAKK